MLKNGLDSDGLTILPFRLRGYINLSIFSAPLS